MSRSLSYLILLCFVGFSFQQKTTEAPKSGGPDAKGIVGGYNAHWWEWRWQARLLVNGRFVCGGSWISSRYVLTAASCLCNYYYGRYIPRYGKEYCARPKVRYAWQLRVILGDYRTNRRDPYEINMPVNAYRIEPRYHDAAILRLYYHVSQVRYRREIVGLSCSRVRTYSNVASTGWGVYYVSSWSGKKYFPTILQEIGLKVMPRCYGLSNFLNSRMICAKVYGTSRYRNVCHGDGGGPLVQYINRRWRLVGISAVTAYSHNGRAWCTNKYGYGGFTRLSNICSWIYYKLYRRFTGDTPKELELKGAAKITPKDESNPDDESGVGNGDIDKNAPKEKSPEDEPKVDDKDDEKPSGGGGGKGKAPGGLGGGPPGPGKLGGK